MKWGMGFPAQVAVVLAGGGVLLAWPLWRVDSSEVIIAVVTGALLAAANALAGYRAITFARGRSYTTFLKVVLGGSGIRMAVVLGLLIVLIKVAGMHPVALTVSLLGFYTVFLVLEIVCIQRNILPPNQG